MQAVFPLLVRKDIFNSEVTYEAALFLYQEHEKAIDHWINQNMYPDPHTFSKFTKLPFDEFISHFAEFIAATLYQSSNNKLSEVMVIALQESKELNCNQIALFLYRVYLSRHTLSTNPLNVEKIKGLHKYLGES